jgi:hypothetical protein
MELVYMPYLALWEVKEVKVGGAKIWNFDKMADIYIPDNGLRRQLRTIVESNISSDNNPIKGMGVISIGDIDFRELGERELQIVRETSLLLFLSALSRNIIRSKYTNAGHFMRTSENFDVMIQHFVPGEPYIAEISGQIVQQTRMGYKIGEKKFYAPSCVPRPLTFELDQTLIDNVIRLKDAKQKKLYKRILQATEFFRQSYYNHMNVSLTSMVLLHIAAFEVLLELSESNPRKDFKDKIENYCSLPSDRLYTNTYETRGGRQKEQRTMKGIWADKYYTLRNHIIHGEKIRGSDFIFRNTALHRDIAAMFFVLLVKMLINEKSGRRINIFYDEIVWHPSMVSGAWDKGFEYNENIIRKALDSVRS